MSLSVILTCIKFSVVNLWLVATLLNSRGKNISIINVEISIEQIASSSSQMMNQLLLHGVTVKNHQSKQPIPPRLNPKCLYVDTGTLDTHLLLDTVCIKFLDLSVSIFIMANPIVLHMIICMRDQRFN